MEERSTAAAISAGTGVTAGLAALLGPASIHLGLLEPLGGFYVFGLGVLLGVPLSLGFGIAGLIRTRSGSERTGRERAWAGIAAAAILSGVLLNGAGLLGGSAPPIHDITTDIDDPPVFSAAVQRATGRSNGTDYPDGGADVPAQQRAAFPDLAPIEVDLPPAEALRRARETAEALGWTVSWVDEETLRMEAFEVTRVFQFVDDIAIRVRRAGSGSVIDLRSNSRVGGGDIGANAARIIAFRDRLLQGQ